jgi:predicted 2-oxoglutarate/Fe(II)-dependent dioxygenase YbiX
MINFYKDFLSKDLCDIIINKYNDDDVLEDAVSVNNSTLEKVQNYNFNKRKIVKVSPETSSELKLISSKILELINHNSEVKFEKIVSFSFNKYREGDFLDWHSDLSEIRKGSTTTVVIELNEEYTGGEFDYIIDGINHSLDKNAGSIFIFDSTTKHRVREIKSGERFSLNCWPL